MSEKISYFLTTSTEFQNARKYPKVFEKLPFCDFSRNFSRKFHNEKREFKKKILEYSQMEEALVQDEREISNERN